MRSMKRRTADRVANAIYRAWLEEMVQSGKITSMPRHARGAWLMDGIRLDALSSAEWIGASRAQIDERRETEAASLRIKMGLSNSRDRVREARPRLAQRQQAAPARKPHAAAPRHLHRRQRAPDDA